MSTVNKVNTDISNKELISNMITIDEYFDNCKSNNIISNIIEKCLLKNNYTRNRRKTIDYIVNKILNKKNINNNESNIIISIITTLNTIKKYTININISYGNIIDKLYLYKNNLGSKKDIINSFKSITNSSIINSVNNELKLFDKQMTKDASTIVTSANVNSANVNPAKDASTIVNSAKVNSAKDASAIVNSANVNSAKVNPAKDASTIVNSAKVNSAKVTSTIVTSTNVKSGNQNLNEIRYNGTLYKKATLEDLKKLKQNDQVLIKIN